VNRPLGSPGAAIVYTVRCARRWFAARQFSQVVLLSFLFWLGTAAAATEPVTRPLVLVGETAVGSGRADAYGRGDGVFTVFSAPTISSSGLVAFEAGATYSPVSNIKLPNSRGGIWVADAATGALRFVMIDGIPAPGTAGNFSGSFSELRVDSLGNVLFDASGLSGAAALGLFHADPMSKLSLVLLQTRPAPGTTGLQFGDIRFGSGFANNGHMGANEPLADNRGRGAFAWNGSTLTNIIVPGQVVPNAAPGTTFLDGTLLAMNSSGHSFLAGGTRVDTTTSSGLWQNNDTGLAQLVQVGQVMPDIAFFDPRFTSFDGGSMNNNGKVAFAATGTNDE